ncbi:MAG: hypothetical protein HYY78_00255 [Betaproteobacteria bacterium]|nr:hypothetical protein [Betaproteobacteria bacterium]
MSEQPSEPRSAAGATELLSAVRFQEELRRVACFGSRVLVGDPLAAAVRKITQNPAFTQSRLLARILSALTYQEGDFRRAEVSALDSDTLSLVITLMDAYAAGTSAREKWIGAVDEVQATLLGAQ